MEPETVERLIRLGEDSRTEFKSLAAAGFDIEPRVLGKAICALANTKGGYLLLGVEDDRRITGAGTPRQADGLMAKVAHVTHSTLVPPLGCTVEKVQVGGLIVVVVEVPAFAPDRPYRTDRYYVRDANTSREATAGELKRLLVSSADLHYDEQPIARTTSADLDMDALGRFVREAYGEGRVADLRSDTRRDAFLVALKCQDRTGALTVAGALLFGQNPDIFLPDARISLVRIDGTQVRSSFADRQEAKGRLLDQIDHALDFVHRHIPQPSTIVDGRRIEHGIPPLAMREAIVNAVVHRDYRVASQVRIMVFNDRVEIVNPGVLLNQLSLDSIRLGGISQRRNPAIASLVARAGRRENLGFGVIEILEAMRGRGLPEPCFEIDGGHFRLTMRTHV